MKTDRFGFLESDYRREDFDPLAMLRDGLRAPPPTRVEAQAAQRNARLASIRSYPTTNNTGPK